jgi:preprotein translocase subunit SecF
MFVLFENTKVDWLGKRKIFTYFSVALLLAGLGSVVFRELLPGGTSAFNLGVDFIGGTVFKVEFQDPPSSDDLRAALSAVGLGEAGVQQTTDRNNLFLVRLPLETGAEGEGAAFSHIDTARGEVDRAIDSFGENNGTIAGVDSVGPIAGVELRNRAVTATLLGLAGMCLFIWYRYDFVYGVAAIVEVFFNVLTTLGLFSIFQWEIDTTIIAALLTLVGFTVNDAVVIFDRVRENLQKHPGISIFDLTNLAINQTLSRTVITAGLVFLAVLGLVLFGGASLRSFSLAMTMGIVLGTYSTIAVACPVKIWLEQLFGAKRLVARIEVEKQGPLASSARRSVSRPGTGSVLADRRKRT